jgi:1,4-dihydroxy-2-naphthoate octaprenyltransferase
VIRPWLLAIRPRTLPAAVAPVAVGSALALADGVWRPPAAMLALCVSLLLQIGVNLANDLFDGLRGVDGPDRRGPLRVTQAGLIPARRVRAAMVLSLAAAAAAGVGLAAMAGWPVLAAGVVAIAAALAYSGGPWPLASHGLGEVAVFLFFGPLAVAGTYFVQARRVPPDVLAASLPMGLLIAAILVVNNLRDIDSDRRAGKRTLAVRWGAGAARGLFFALLAAAYLLPVRGAPLGGGWPPLLSLPLALRVAGDMLTSRQGAQFNRCLGDTALLALIFGLLQAWALITARA